MTRQRRWIAWLVAALITAGAGYLLIQPQPAPFIPAPTVAATAAPSITLGVGAGATGASGGVEASATLVPSASDSGACLPTDQDQYVYHPSRLQVIAPCIVVTGTVATVLTEADGDLHIRVAVDPAYQSLINPVNVAGQHGDLVVEPVCVHPVTQSDAITTCAGDPDPLTSLPTAGQHVRLEGRYVLDMDHGGWAELHPLYRWAVQ